MKRDLLYKIVFSHQNSLESIAILTTYYRPNTTKLWEYMCMFLSILFHLCQRSMQLLSLMLPTVRTLPAELNMNCKCSLASNSNRVHSKVKVRNFHQPCFWLFFHLSFYLLFKYCTFLYFFLRSQHFLIDLFIVFCLFLSVFCLVGEILLIVLVALGVSVPCIS